MNEDWANLPDPIITQILSYLTVRERCRVGATCKHWLQCLETPMLWKTFSCGFYLQDDSRILKCVEQYGHFVSKLEVSLNQFEKWNRENAVSVLEQITSMDEIRMTHLTIKFMGENPLFYAGQEFMTALTNLFVKLGSKGKDASPLKYLNLSGLQANFNDDFINQIPVNCPNLEYLNILNRMLVCNISSDCIANLVQQCGNLRVLHLYHTSLSDDVLKALSQPGRKPLQRLGVVCRRQEKYGEDLTSEVWSNLVTANPNLKVELGFDHTCPLHRVSEILKPEIPVEELYLGTFTRIYSEINLAVTYYEQTLQKLVVNTRPSPDLQEALLNLAQHCKKLTALYVYCVVEKEVVDKILELCPAMKEKGSYILKWKLDPEPWTVGQEEGD